jgi:hypothetical protein
MIQTLQFNPHDFVTALEVKHRIAEFFKDRLYLSNNCKEMRSEVAVDSISSFLLSVNDKPVMI